MTILSKNITVCSSCWEENAGLPRIRTPGLILVRMSYYTLALPVTKSQLTVCDREDMWLLKYSKTTDGETPESRLLVAATRSTHRSIVYLGAMSEF